MTPELFLVTGVSAAGKSTVAEALAARFPRGVHVRGDQFRRAIVTGRVEPGADPPDEAARQLRLRYQLGASTADAYWKAGFTVVLQDVVLGPWLQDVVGMVRARPLYVVVLDPDEDAIRAREAARPKTGYDERWTIERLRRGMHESTPRIGLWLDTSRQTVDETVDTIIARQIEALVPG